MKFRLFVIPLCLALLAQGASLTLNEALSRVEAGHPWFHTRESLAALGQIRHDTARSGPAASVSLEVENILGTGSLSAARDAETTLQFSRVFDRAGRRDSREALAVAQGEAERLQWLEKRRALLAEAAQRFIRVTAGQITLELAQEHADLAHKTAITLKQRHSSAVAPAGDLAQAQLALSEAQLEAEHAEHLLLSARQSLATLWGAEEPDFDAAIANFDTLPDIADYPVLAAQLKDTPIQARHAAEFRWQQAREKLARRTIARGDIRWSAGLRRNEATDDFGFVLGVGYTWPDTTAPVRLAETRAEQDRSRADAETALLEARAVLYALLQELNHARIEFLASRDEMEPAAQAWVDSIEAGVSRGRYGATDAIAARTALFEARCRRIAAATEYHSTLVTIEQMLAGSANP